MIYSSQQIAQAVSKLNGKPEKITANLVSWLQQKKLISLLPKIIKQLEKIAAKENQKNIIQVYTAHPLPVDMKNKINQLINAKQADVIQENIDKNLIGGIKIVYKNKVYDATVSNKIIKLKKYLAK